MSCIKSRMLEFIESKGISKYKFYKETGMTRGVLESKSGITEDNITKFIAYYPNVNLDWLIRGIGEREINTFKSKTDSNTSHDLLPLPIEDTQEAVLLKDRILNLLVNDKDIQDAFKLFIGKEINLYASKKLMNLVKDEDFFRIIANYLQDLSSKQN
ncbi:hypothetical protein ACSTS3_10500 [Aquimarina muelleri]|uniref:hypothetical protein n=1 Tax=Aquimarina muelleri TaxID=279356 RepID=UPI003F685D85